ncbi:aminoglycoside phosphotransferase family protein [Streptomyces sp. NPDC047081]|uniref:aminoglycoside phosphotransferase family protein n=1 Tax=Streptomyces sp. NPDC047081 TaxID=3154706 RepID=UPI0033CC4F45
MTMHDGEIIMEDEAVQELIATQFPEWNGLRIRRLTSSGTVNAIFRIGDDLAARFPLRLVDPEVCLETLQREARASQRFADHCPVAAPRPVALGKPGSGYPLPWSVQTWVPGDVATAGFGGSAEFARDLAGLIKGLRTADTEGRTFHGEKRGGELSRHDEWVELCFEKSEGLLDVPLLRRLWSHFRELSRTSGDVMSHGDLTPNNVLVDRGRLAGVLDSGDFAPADPALDVISAWHLLDDTSRAVFREELGCDDLEWERSKAWAFEQCMGAIWYYIDTNPAMYNMGRTTLDRIVANTKV